MPQTATAASTVTAVAAVAAIVTAVAAAVVPRLTLQYYAPPNLTDTFPPFSDIATVVRSGPCPRALLLHVLTTMTLLLLLLLIFCGVGTDRTGPKVRSGP